MYIESYEKLEKDQELKKIWHGLNNTTNFGTMSYLYQKYGKPKTVEEFYEKYTEDAPLDIEDDIKKHGRSAWWLGQMMNKLEYKDKCRRDSNFYKIYVIKKLFYDTIQGMEKEEEIKNMVENNTNFKLKKTDSKADVSMGVDFWLYNENGKVAAIQVKPHSFFKGNHNDGLIEDRLKAKRNEEKIEEKYGIPTYFIVYEKDGSWKARKNGKHCFKYSDFLTNKGLTIN